MVTFETLFSSMKFSSIAEKKRMEILFNDYMNNLPENFFKNQFDLAKEYEGSTYEDWVKILKHPAFNTWKSEQIGIIATTQTDKALAGDGCSDKDSLNLLKARQDILRDENTHEKPTIIVIPESLFFKEEK